MNVLGEFGSTQYGGRYLLQSHVIHPEIIISLKIKNFIYNF